jgi:hypothetical protein
MASCSPMETSAVVTELNRITATPYLSMGTSSGPMSTYASDENMRQMRAGNHAIPVEQRPSTPDGATSGAGPSSDQRRRTSRAASERAPKAHKHILEPGAERHKSRDKKKKIN